VTRDESISSVLPAGTAPAAAAARRMTAPEFEDFYQRHSSALWGYIRRMCGEASAADDLFQKTFFNFLGAEVPVSDENQQKAYIFRIATNVVFDHFRSERPRGEWQPPPVAPGDRAAILRTDMERMFRRLNPQERALLWLAHVEGYDHREIATILNLKENSIRVLLFRARKRLAAVMRQHGMFPEAQQ
jgi:RNA polymerase sigma factor, sigma-70 family